MPSLVVDIPSGTLKWVESGASQTIENHEPAELKLVRIEFLTKPL
jgi:hypothetical protein